MSYSKVQSFIITQLTVLVFFFVFYSKTNAQNPISAPMVNNPVYKPGWNLIFQDEFSGFMLNPLKWNKMVNLHGNNPNDSANYERAYYKSGSNNINVSNGTLKIKCVKENYTGVWWENWELGILDSFNYEYTSGWIETVENFHYGYYEIKCKLPKGESFWPAFWTFSGNPWNEIDIYENIMSNGHNIIGTNYHVGNPSNTNCSNPTKDGNDISVQYDITDNWYTVGLDWTPTGMKWYVNNHLAREVNTPVCNLFVTNPGKVILNLALEGFSQGSYLTTMNNQNRFPGTFEIDYVRIYTRDCNVGVSMNNFTAQQGYTNQNDRPRLIGDFNGDQKTDILAFGYNTTYIGLGQSNGTFSNATALFNDCTKEQGWTFQNTRPRLAGDVNGDGYDDIIGFGYDWTSVWLGNSSGTFGNKIYAIQNFTVEQGWTDQNTKPRIIADVNGDGRSDIIGFGSTGTYVSLGQANGTFSSATFVLNQFSLAQNWNTQEERPRMMADINGDGRDDIIGFGWTYTYVALGQTNGTFGTASIVLTDFTKEQGWLTLDSRPRLFADVNGDGRDDLVAFGFIYTTVNLGTSSGGFGNKNYILEEFTNEQGWTSQAVYPRLLADVNGDCKTDIIGFGMGETKISISTSNSTVASFNSYQNVTTSFVTDGGWVNQSTRPRFICDIDGDGNNDILGFGYNKVYSLTCINTGANSCPSAAITRKKDEENNSENNSFLDNLIYPNPSSGQITVLRPNEDYNRISVFDGKGRLVVEQEIEGGSSILNLVPGFYLVKISGAKGELIRKVIIE